MTLRQPKDAGAVTLSPTLDQATRVSWKAPIAFTLFTIVSALLFIGLSNDGKALFQFSPAGDAWQIPVLLFASRPVGVVGVVLLALISIVSIWLTFRRRRTPLWLAAIYIAVLLVAFLAWAASSAQTNVIPLAGLLAGSLSLAIPLVYGSLAGVIGERVGVVNIAIEGQLLFGAFSSALVASITGSVWAGLIAAAVAGVLVGMVLAVFSIKYFVDQIIVGVVLNVLIVGLTSFLYSEMLTPNAATLNTPPRFEVWAIPGLADIPLIGPMLFRQTPIVYLAYIAVFLVWWGLFRTRWGLRLRSVGEHPTAADTVGINVERTRFWNVSLAGGIAGLGGSFYTLGLVGAFGQEMTNGAGYIALAAVIFGKWHPVRAALAALLFGFTTSLQNTLSIIGSPVPSQFMLMLPYVVTILAVAGFVGASRGPAAAGQPYIK
ncbi:MAG TPA: ABC transporter permease [Microbacteriaceae bacterium]|nr:ABC transporter permease [Microbacteriaceae bacterium]